MNQLLNSGLSIVIPIFNEAENIKPLFKKFQEFEQVAEFPFHFILVDGCSEDGTPELIKEEMQTCSVLDVELLEMEQRRGYGFDIMQGLAISRYDTLAWTHADLQTDLCDLIEGYQILKSSSKETVVKGRRVNRGLLERFFTIGMQIYTFINLKVYLDDINAQPKLFKYSFYASYLNKKSPNDFSLDLFFLLTAKLNKYKIKSFKVFFEPRKAGEAKGGGGSWSNRIILVKRTINYIKKIKKRF